MDKQGDEDMWTPWPLAKPRLPALTDENLAARASIMDVLKKLTILQRDHVNSGLTRLYLDACVALYDRLRRSWTDIDPALVSLDQPMPHLLVLHFLYHYTIMELFRPFTTTPAFASPQSTPLRKEKLPIEPAASAFISASQQIRQILHRITTLYGGRQTPFVFAQVGICVAFEILPSTPPLSPSFSPAASTSLLASPRLLARMDRTLNLLRFALLGIKQAAARAEYPLPAEAPAILAEAECERPDKNGRRPLQAGRVFDLSRSRTDIQAARLNDVIKELEALTVH